MHFPFKTGFDGKVSGKSFRFPFAPGGPWGPSGPWGPWGPAGPWGPIPPSPPPLIILSSFSIIWSYMLGVGSGISASSL